MYQAFKDLSLVVGTTFHINLTYKLDHNILLRKFTRIQFVYCKGYKSKTYVTTFRTPLGSIPGHFFSENITDIIRHSIFWKFGQ